MLSLLQSEACCESNWNTPLFSAWFPRQILSEAWDLCYSSHSSRRCCGQHWIVRFSVVFGWSSSESELIIPFLMYKYASIIITTEYKIFCWSSGLAKVLLSCFSHVRDWLQNTKELWLRLFFDGASNVTQSSFQRHQNLRDWNRISKFSTLS